MIEVYLDSETSVCDHCGKNNLLKTVAVRSNNLNANFGIFCLGKELNITITGNPHKAIARVKAYLNNKPEDEIEEIIDNLINN